MTYKPPRQIPYPLTAESGDEQLPIVTNDGNCLSPVEFGDGDEPIPVIVSLTGAQWQRLYSALLFGADVIYPNAREQVIYDFVKWWDCPVDLCEIIQNCIGGQLTALQNSISAVSSAVNDVAQDVNSVKDKVDTLETQNTARQPEPVSVANCDANAVFGGCIYLVQRFNQFILDIFEQAEVSAADSSQEYLAIIFEAIPGLETLPVDELWEISNWMFENQQAQYQADYTLSFEEQAACELYCLIVANDCTLNTSIIGNWLDGIIAAIPNNKAAEIYGRFAPSAQSFINQVNELVQGTQSLQSFFDDLHRMYAVGTNDPYPVPVFCDCQPPFTHLLYDFTSGQHGWAIHNLSGANRGQYVAGQGYQSTRFQEGSPFYVGVMAIRTVPSARQVRRVEYDIEMTSGTQQGNAYSRFIGSGVGRTIQTGALAAGSHTIGGNIAVLSVTANSLINIDRWLWETGTPVSGFATVTIKRVRLYFVNDDVPTDWGGTPQ